MSTRQQREADKALRVWRIGFFKFFKPKCLLIPFSVINSVHRVPHTDHIFSYRDVFVFGIRVARFQMD